MRKTIEETLNAPLDEEASELVGAERYERTAGRETYHSGQYARRLVMGVREGDLGVPKLHRAAARTVCDGFAETLAYTEFPPEHWRRVRTNNGTERNNRKIRRRTRIVGAFPDGNSALMLATARLKYIADARAGQEEVPGHVQTGGDGQTEGKDGGLVEDGAEDG